MFEKLALVEARYNEIESLLADGSIYETPDVAAKLLKEQKAELFNLRFQHAIHQLENPQKIVETKKNIAKILTVMTEKQA